MNEKIYPAVLRDYLGTGPTNNTVYYDLKALQSVNLLTGKVFLLAQ